MPQRVNIIYWQHKVRTSNHLIYTYGVKKTMAFIPCVYVFIRQNPLQCKLNSTSADGLPVSFPFSPSPSPSPSRDCAFWAIASYSLVGGTNYHADVEPGSSETGLQKVVKDKALSPPFKPPSPVQFNSFSVWVHAAHLLVSLFLQ